jgi:hypothetical protein
MGQMQSRIARTAEDVSKGGSELEERGREGGRLYSCVAVILPA